MGFVREEKELGKKFEVVDYLNLIGARTITGKPFLNVLDNVIVDRENNYFLVSRGGEAWMSREDMLYVQMVMC